MTAFSNEGEAQILQWLCRNTSLNTAGLGGASGTNWTPSSASGTATQGLYISLWTSATTAAHLEAGGGSGTEVPATVNSNASGYARKFIDFTAIGSVSTSTDTAVGTDITGPTSSTAVSWTASEDWATGATTVKWFGLHLGSGASATLIMYGELVDSGGTAAPKNVSSGDTVTLATDALTITLK